MSCFGWRADTSRCLFGSLASPDDELETGDRRRASAARACLRPAFRRRDVGVVLLEARRPEHGPVYHSCLAAGFADAVASADQVGFVLGGGEGYVMGVYATGPARLVVSDFRAE